MQKLQDSIPKKIFIATNCQKYYLDFGARTFYGRKNILFRTQV